MAGRGHRHGVTAAAASVTVGIVEVKDMQDGSMTTTAATSSVVVEELEEPQNGVQSAGATPVVENARQSGSSELATRKPSTPNGTPTHSSRNGGALTPRGRESAAAAAGAAAGGAAGSAGVDDPRESEEPLQLYPQELTIAGYKAWVRKYPALAKKYEDSIRMLSFLVPARFGNAELFSEVVYSLVNLLGLYNDHVIASGAKPDAQGGVAEFKESESSLSNMDGASRAGWALTALANVQVAVEMLAFRFGGQRRKWNTIAAIEILRALLKFYVLQKSGKSVLIDGGRKSTPVPSAALDPAGADKGQSELLELLGGGPSAGDSQPTPAPRWWKGPRGVTRLPLPPDFPASMPSGSNDATEQQLQLLGEVLYILRPVVYVLSRRALGGKSWVPVLLSLATDVASWQCSKRAIEAFSPAPQPTAQSNSWILKAGLWFLNTFSSAGPEVSAEMTRRQMLWGFYLLRSPVFETLIKARLNGVVDSVSWIPLVSMFVAYLRDMLLYFQKHYFYVAGSS